MFSETFLSPAVGVPMLLRNNCFYCLSSLHSFNGVISDHSIHFLVWHQIIPSPFLCTAAVHIQPCNKMTVFINNLIISREIWLKFVWAQIVYSFVRKVQKSFFNVVTDGQETTLVISDIIPVDTILATTYSMTLNLISLLVNHSLGKHPYIINTWNTPLRYVFIQSFQQQTPLRNKIMCRVSRCLTSHSHYY